MQPKLQSRIEENVYIRRLFPSILNVISPLKRIDEKLLQVSQDISRRVTSAKFGGSPFIVVALEKLSQQHLYGVCFGHTQPPMAGHEVLVFGITSPLI